MARTAMPKTKQFGGKTYFIYNNEVLSSDDADKLVALWGKISPRHQAKKDLHFSREGYVVYTRTKPAKGGLTFLHRKRLAKERKPDEIMPLGMPEFDFEKGNDVNTNKSSGRD